MQSGLSRKRQVDGKRTKEASKEKVKKWVSMLDDEVEQAEGKSSNAHEAT